MQMIIIIIVIRVSYLPRTRTGRSREREKKISFRSVIIFTIIISLDRFQIFGLNNNNYLFYSVINFTFPVRPRGVQYNIIPRGTVVRTTRDRVGY